jgi:hypothetical protein
VSDLSLTVEATHADIEAALALKMTELSITPDNNDYAFVQVPTSDETPTQIERVERYKFNGTVWLFEYALNNSGFTAEQWAALNSGITSGLVAKLSDLPTNSELTTLLAGKQDTINDLSDIRSGAAKGETAYQKPVGGIPSEDMSSGVQSSLQKAENAAPQSTTYNKTEVDGMIGGIDEKIPSGASAQNKLVDQQTMNSSIATATATYRGAYNLVSDLELTTAATEQQIAAALDTVMAAATPPIVPDNNDYCYVQVPTADATPTQIARVDRYKFNGTAWGFEYSLNNSGFTAAQWAALNSGITSGLVTKLSDLPTNSELTNLLAGKQDTINDLSDIRSGAAAGATAYQKPQGGIPETDLTAALQTALASFITKAVSDLTNYYLKSELYTKSEVDQLIAAINQFEFVSVQTLPTASADTMGKLYLVPSADPKTQNVKDEYITLAVTEQDTTTYSWECIGSTAIDLSNYYTKTQTDAAITAALNAALADYSTTSQVGTMISNAIDTALARYYNKTQVDNLLAGKQAIINDRATIGDGYALCSTAGDTQQKEVSITNFLLIKNGVVSVKFANAITVASPTLKINDIAAKAIYLNGAAVQPGWILAGVTVNMRYNGAQFDIISMMGPDKTDDELLVDMGLPSGLLWATRNIDITQANGFAKNIFQYECSFFSWGNTDGHNPTATNSFAPYSWGNANTSEPYSSSPGASLSASFGLSFDAAFMNLGNQWRMPTTEEFAELFNNIDYINPDGTVIETTQANKLVTVNGVVGILLKSKNNSRMLFFPCSGYGNGQSWSVRGSNGYYWSSSLYSATNGRYLDFGSGGVYPQYSNYRFYGFSVRPVQNLLSPAQ